ncbi:MAG TPA: hypothetical protein VFG32_08205 [Bacteroidota bacterium]|nr:hypothetical protein [Bacteroidota bacterium]
MDYRQWIFLVLFFSGCGSTLDRIEQIPEKLTGSLKRDADTIGMKLGSGLIVGVRDSLTGDKSRQELTRLIDSLVATLGSSARKEAPRLVDSLLGKYLQVRLHEIGGVAREELAAVRNELLGARSRILLQELRDSLLGNGTVSRAGALRDELLGPATNTALRSIVDSAMVSLVNRYKEDLAPALRGDFDLFKDYGKELLITLGVIALVIVGYWWMQARKYQKTVAVLAQQIHEVGDQEIYDDLTNRIQRRAQEEGVEPVLRKTLASHGLLGAENWRPPRKHNRLRLQAVE